MIQINQIFDVHLNINSEADKKNLTPNTIETGIQKNMVVDSDACARFDMEEFQTDIRMIITMEFRFKEHHYCIFRSFSSPTSTFTRKIDMRIHMHFFP